MAKIWTFKYLKVYAWKIGEENRYPDCGGGEKTGFMARILTLVGSIFPRKKVEGKQRRVEVFWEYEGYLTHLPGGSSSWNRGIVHRGIVWNRAASWKRSASWRRAASWNRVVSCFRAASCIVLHRSWNRVASCLIAESFCILESCGIVLHRGIVPHRDIVTLWLHSTYHCELTEEGEGKMWSKLRQSLYYRDSNSYEIRAECNNRALKYKATTRYVEKGHLLSSRQRYVPFCLHAIMDNDKYDHVVVLTCCMLVLQIRKEPSDIRMEWPLHWLQGKISRNLW